MSNELVYALSSLGQVSFSRYKELFNTLYRPEDDKDQADINHRTLVTRILDSLGYFEFGPDNGRVFISPPALVMLPSPGLPRLLLTGARTPSLIARVKGATADKRDRARIYRQCQSRHGLNLPDCILLEAADIDSAEDIARKSGILLSAGDPAGWVMAMSSVSTDDVETRLTFVPRDGINWECRIFDVEALRFSVRKGSDLPNCRLVEYTDPLTQQKMHWLWHGGTASDIDRDWGRYLVLRHCHKNIVIYDEPKQYLGIPLTVPLPKIIARAAALCSGKAPSICRIDRTEPCIDRDLKFYIYRDVPQSVAEIIAGKTGQDLTLTRIEERKERRGYD